MTAEPVRIAVLGDSLTEGLGDPRPGGDWRGWAPLLADGLPAPGQRVQLVNVAHSGALTRDVAGRQLRLARLVRPRLAAVIAGANDTLRASFDIDTVARALDTAVGTLAADGATVLTVCLPDPGRMLGLPAALARPLARRMQAVNAVVHALTTRHSAGVVHVHLADHPVVAERAAWSADRLHPSELGHRVLAREFHAALAARGLAAGPVPPTEPDGRPTTRGQSLWWLATRGTAWVGRRCTDLLPGLLRLAGAETVHRLAGTAAVLDAADHRATAAAIAGLKPPEVKDVLIPGARAPRQRGNASTVPT